MIKEARFDAMVYAQAGIYPRRIQMQHEAIPYATSVNLDFNGVAHKRIDLGGNLSLTTTNLDFGKSFLLRLAADGSTRTLDFPSAGAGSAAPPSSASIASAPPMPTQWRITSWNPDGEPHEQTFAF